MLSSNLPLQHKIIEYKPTHDRIEIIGSGQLDSAGQVTQAIATPAQELPQTVVELSPTQLTHIDGIPRYSNSEIQTFKKCRRKWWLTYVRQLAPNTPDSITGTRAIGNRIHRVMQRYYVPAHEHSNDLISALEDVIRDDWAAIEEQYRPLGGVTQEIIGAYRKQCDLERAMVEGYVDWLAETGADSDFEVIESEGYLEAQLPGVNAMIVGRLDVRVRRFSDQKKYFIDHKTLGTFLEAGLALGMDEQMLTYMVLELLHDPVDSLSVGAIYNMIRRVKRTGTAKPPFYRRMEVQHSPKELANFTQRLIRIINEMEFIKQRLLATNDISIVYPSPTRDCHWSCPHVTVCRMFDDGSRAEDALASLYKAHDPYAYYVAPQQAETHDNQL